MSEELHTVEAAAERLKLHPKTVLRMIRQGRLKATRIGKSYRILRSELERLAGGGPPAQAARTARVTSIVDLPDVPSDKAQRLAVWLTAARSGVSSQDEPMSLDIVHDPARGHVKVVIVGSPGDAAAMLKLVDFWLEQPS